MSGGGRLGQDPSAGRHQGRQLPATLRLLVGRVMHGRISIDSREERTGPRHPHPTGYARANHDTHPGPSS